MKTAYLFKYRSHFCLDVGSSRKSVSYSITVNFKKPPFYTIISYCLGGLNRGPILLYANVDPLICIIYFQCTLCLVFDVCVQNKQINMMSFQMSVSSLSLVVNSKDNAFDIKGRGLKVLSSKMDQA